MSVAETRNGNGEVAATESPLREYKITHDDSRFANWLDTAKFEHIQRLAVVFTKSQLVPDHFRGQGNLSNCIIAVQMAFRCGVDPLTFLQKCYIVHGKPGIEAQLAIAMANQSGIFANRIKWRFEGQGKTRQCTAYVKDKESGETLEATVTWQMVEAEGWNKKNGSKWLTIPDMMFCYRSAMFLLRLYAPDVIMGMHSADELEDIGAGTVTVEAISPTDIRGNEGLRNRLLGAKVESEPEPEVIDTEPEPEPVKETKQKSRANSATINPDADQSPFDIVIAEIEAADTIDKLEDVRTMPEWSELHGAQSMNASRAFEDKASRFRAQGEGRMFE